MRKRISQGQLRSCESISPVLSVWLNQIMCVSESHKSESRMSGASSRQSQMVADEMFPDGPGPLDFVDVEDGVRIILGTEC